MTPQAFEKLRQGWEQCKDFVLCIGISEKHYIPAFKGLGKFKGISSHTTIWPKEGIDIKCTRVGVIAGEAKLCSCSFEVGLGTAFVRTSTRLINRFVCGFLSHIIVPDVDVFDRLWAKGSLIIDRTLRLSIRSGVAMIGLVPSDVRLVARLLLNVAADAATNSASVVDRAMAVCLLLLQEMAAPASRKI
jgi:hypothetical protein